MICALLFAVSVPTWVAVLGVIVLVLIAAYMLAGIFGPSPDYKIESGNELPAHDLLESRRVTLDEWRHRPITERAPELLGWIFERQQ